MPTFRLKDHSIVNVPEGLSKGGAQDWLIQQGHSPENVGLAVSGPETGGALDEFLIGAGHFFSERIPGLDSETAPPEGLASTLGQMAPAVAASFAVPGSGLAGVAARNVLCRRQLRDQEPRQPDL